MKIEQRTNGSYRVRKMFAGKTYSLTFDHKPTQKEITEQLAEITKSEDTVTNSFGNCAKSYIKSKSNVLSPSTIKGYNAVLSYIPKDFTQKKIRDITQVDIQLVINDYASDHSPKSVRNLHGFISAVLRQYRPNMIISTTLPQKVKYEPYIPSKEDIQKIINAAKDSEYSIPIRLGCLGLRRSEVCALAKEDLDGNILTVNKAKVQRTDNSWYIKPLTKTTDGMREIYVPDELAKDIRECEKVCSVVPNQLLKALQRYQRQLDIPQFRFHDLRHFYASFAHENGMSDADIMESGGWKSDYTMKTVYRHALKKEKEEAQKKIAAGMFG